MENFFFPNQLSSGLLPLFFFFCLFVPKLKEMQVFHVCAAEFTEASMISELFNKITNKNTKLALPIKNKIQL